MSLWALWELHSFALLKFCGAKLTMRPRMFTALGFYCSPWYAITITQHSFRLIYTLYCILQTYIYFNVQCQAVKDELIEFVGESWRLYHGKKQMPRNPMRIIRTIAQDGWRAVAAPPLSNNPHILTAEIALLVSIGSFTRFAQFDSKSKI
jgi:hypothetical protein